ncbi:MAG TPA: cyclic nucleotide-binding domain-containing protein [Thermoanaerobaculia bacterium]|jgi:cAMP-dependent protein kinase regulator
MAEETESGASLLARREYGRAVPLLKREHEKYPSNPRIRLQYADALAGAGMADDAVEQYEATAKYYEDNGLTVQAIAVRKKGEKLRAQIPSKEPASEAGKSEPLFSRPVPKSALFEVLSEVEREAIVREMELETHDEGSVIINEGDPGTSMYLIASGEVKVYTRGTGASAGSLYLARLGEGDFFGEVSVLSGKPRTATITASQRTELLRLDKSKLDGVLSKHPGIRKVLDEFYKKRANHTVEAMIESLKKR